MLDEFTAARIDTTTRDHRSAAHTDPVRTLDYARELAARDHGLAVVAVARRGGTVGASVVSAGVMPHPATGREVVAFVSGAAAHRLEPLRHGQPITVTFRAGWQWVTVEGAAELCGPDDPHPQISAASLPRLLRDIFTAAGGGHDDWDAYDRAMAEERLDGPSALYDAHDPGPAYQFAVVVAGDGDLEQAPAEVVDLLARVAQTRDPHNGLLI